MSKIKPAKFTYTVKSIGFFNVEYKPVIWVGYNWLVVRYQYVGEKVVRKFIIKVAYDMLIHSLSFDVFDAVCANAV